MFEKATNISRSSALSKFNVATIFKMHATNASCILAQQQQDRKTYGEEIRGFPESHLSGLDHLDGVLKGLLLRHLGPVDRDPLELETSRSAVSRAGVAVMAGVTVDSVVRVFAVACKCGCGSCLRNIHRVRNAVVHVVANGPVPVLECLF